MEKKSMFLRRKEMSRLAIPSVAIVLLFAFADPLLAQISRLFLEIQRLQNHYNRELVTMLAALRHGGHPAAWWMLIALGFLYGVVHALGPGHGKAIIATFLLTRKSGYKSALGIAIGGGLCQGIGAVLWVGCTLGALQWLARDVVDRVQWMAVLSFVLTMAIGAYLMIRAGRQLRRYGDAPACNCGHEAWKTVAKSDCKACLLAIMAIGARPCSGSILILSVAALWHLWFVGVAMTFALTCGTIVTVTALALLSVCGRDRLAANVSEKGRVLQNGVHLAAFAGGALLVLLGGALLVARLSQPAAVLPI